MAAPHPIPDAALASHLAILGKTGAGKSYAARSTVERVLARGERACIVDPTGVWWGLRLAEDGKRSSRFPVVIAGGRHGDLPLAAEHGAALAKVVGTTATPMILDTSSLTVGERTRLFTAFAEALIVENTGPLHLVLDEAHLFAPQTRVPDPQSAMMVHAANSLVALGRARGLRVALLTQRPAKLHKDSLTQVETLVAMRLVAPQDRRAVEEWIGDQADKKRGAEIIASLPGLPRGEAWVWAPDQGVLARAAFPRIVTFDSMQPAAQGARDLPPIDVAAIRSAMSNASPRPVETSKKVRSIETFATDIVAAEQRGYARGLEEGRAEGRTEGERWARAAMARLPSVVADALRTVAGELEAAPEPRQSRVTPVLASRARLAPAARATDGAAEIGAERKPLAALASVHPAGMTEAQWAVAAGFKRSGGTWTTYRSRLRTAGRIEQGDDGRWFATEAGLQALGSAPHAMPAPGPELVDFWASRIPGAGPMLRHLAGIYPRALARDALAEALGLAASGRTFGTYLSRLRSADLVVGRDTVRAADFLFSGHGGSDG